MGTGTVPSRDQSKCGLAGVALLAGVSGTQRHPGSLVEHVARSVHARGCLLHTDRDRKKVSKQGLAGQRGDEQSVPHTRRQTSTDFILNTIRKRHNARVYEETSIITDTVESLTTLLNRLIDSDAPDEETWKVANALSLMKDKQAKFYPRKDAVDLSVDQYGSLLSMKKISETYRWCHRS